MVLLNKGDECILPAPYWVSYAVIVELVEGVPVEVRAGVDQLKAAITPKTKMILFPLPNNPSGAVFNREKLASFAAVLADRPDIIVVSDEIYEHMNYLGKHVGIATMPGMRDRTVTINVEQSHVGNKEAR